MKLRSPLSRARGLGSARDGTRHFLMQRLSAVALIPLALWFVFSVARLTGGEYETVRHWVRAPAVAVVLILFIVAALYHSMLGVQVVIEDYVAHEGRKLASLMLMKFAHAIVAVSTVFAVLKVALGV